MINLLNFASYVENNKSNLYRLTRVLSKSRKAAQYAYNAFGHLTLNFGFSKKITISVGGWDGLTTSQVVAIESVDHKSFKIETVNSFYLLEVSNELLD